MRLLVSTPRVVLDYDVESNEIEPIDHEREEYYGISWRPSGKELSLSHSGLNNDSLKDIHTYAMSEVGWISTGKNASWQFLSAPHQMLWVDEEWLLITNTGRNAITRMSAADGSIVNYRYDDFLWDRLSPSGCAGAHLNSLFYKDKVLYVVAHNFTKGSYIIELDWPSMAEIQRNEIPGASGVHNLWIDDDGHRITCDSNNGAIINAQSGKEIWNNGRQGFTRGLAATEDAVFVGHTDFSERGGRYGSETGIWIIDRHTWKTTDYLYMGQLGGVHEIRIWDVMDECHHGNCLSADALSLLKLETDVDLAKPPHPLSQEILLIPDKRPAVVSERLEKSNRVISDSKTWDRQLGYIFTNRDSVIRADSDGFAVSTLKTKDVAYNSIAADVLVGPDLCADDHGSLVARYKGPSDSNMYAALMKAYPDEKTIHASIWVHSGEWRMLEETVIPELNLNNCSSNIVRFRAEFILAGVRLVFRVNDKELIAVSDSSIVEDGDFGVRVMGSSFGFCNVHLKINQ